MDLTSASAKEGLSGLATLSGQLWGKPLPSDRIQKPRPCVAATRRGLDRSDLTKEMFAHRQRDGGRVEPSVGFPPSHRTATEAGPRVPAHRQFGGTGRAASAPVQ
jgi:hypothetical protein